MDWVAVIRELRESGVSLTRIAATAGSGLSTVSELADGTTGMPNWKLGNTVLELHRIHVKQAKRKAKAEAPTEA